MGRRQTFLLLLVLSFASFVSAQTVSITFLDEWGAPASRLLEHGKALLRVIDPAANTSPDRDSVAVDLSSTVAMDTDFTNLLETGEATGVFEGEVNLTTDFYENYIDDEGGLLNYPQTYPTQALDTAVATYGGASGSVEAAPSLTDLLDDSGASPAGFALGETVRVRVRDAYADKNMGTETTMATLSFSGGGSETLLLVETGGHTGVFEASFRLQAAVGQTITVTHSDANGFSSSSDSAAVTASSVRLIDEEGRSADLYLEDSDAIARVAHLAADLDPYAFDTVTVTASMQVSGDVETMTLRETGWSTGVFEGKMDLSTGYISPGNGRLDAQPVFGPSGDFDTVAVSYSGSTDSAGLTGSITRLFDEAGEEIVSLPLHSNLFIRVETFNDSGFIDSTFVEVRSLTTNDVETLELRETGPFSNVFEGTIEVFWSSAPGPGDGFLAASVNDTVRVDHFDANGYTRSRAEATAARGSVRFVDEAGQPVSILLEGGTARVRVHDRVSQPTAPPTELESLLGRDTEAVSLAPFAGSSYVWEGSVPLDTDNYYGFPNDGELTVNGNTNPVNQPDLVTASSNGAIAEAMTAPALLEFLNGEVVAAGAVLQIRAIAPLANLSPAYPNYLMLQVRSKRGGDSRNVYLNETGADTDVFEGTIGTRTDFDWDPDTLYVEPSDTVTAFFNSYYEMGGAAATVAIVPKTVELVDGDGNPVSVYLFGETVHVRVTETAANADPGTAEVLTATVQAWRRSDDDPDVETVGLFETGPDTGVFEGSLPTELIDWQAYPYPGDGVLRLLDIYPPYGDLATVTATHGDVSDTARMEDSVVRFTNAAGEDWPVVVANSQAHVWLRRPAGNTTAGVDFEMVELWTHDSPNDFEALTLVETGPDTGIFTGSIPVAQATTPTLDNGALEGQPGITVEVDKRVTVTLRSVDTALIAQVPFFPPEAQDDFASTVEGTPVVIDVIANDDDPDGDELGVTAVTQGTKGTVSFTPGGATVTYTPNAGATGSDSFTYTVSDFGGIVDGNTDTATVNVTINSLNEAPDAVNDSATTNEDTAVNIAVKANDSDPEDDPLTVTSVTPGANGTAAIEGDGTVTFTPNANFHGSDSFTYTLSDGQLTDTATVSVTVVSVNDGPVAVNDLVNTTEETPVNVAVRANDSDPEGDPLTVSAADGGANGSSVIEANGTVTYTPNVDFRGMTSFGYTISDGNGGTASATVSVYVSNVNDPPVAVDDSATTNEDASVNFPVKDNDSDPDGDSFSVVSVTQGAKGSVVINNSPGAFHWLIYTPNANANGSDTVTYTIADSNGGTDTATVNITINPVNDAPDAVTDAVTTPEDTPFTIDPRTNDSDVDGNPLTVTSVNGGTRGAPVLNANGTITYTPNPNVSGTDFIQYHLSDGNGGTDSALVNITITPVNDPPNANNDLPLVTEDTPLAIAVLSNDNDPENNVLTVTAYTQPTKGTAVLNADKTITYSPDLNANGTDSFNYTISDGNGGTDTATVNITIIPVNDPPVANADSATVAEEGTVDIPVLANDTEPENSTLTLVSVTQGAHGTVTIVSGQARYQPAANYAGPDTFTYTVRDPANLTATGTVNVTVTPVNDPPLAGPDSATTNEGVAVTVSVLANDADIDGGALSVVAVTQGTNGAVTTNGATVTYTPAAGFFGADSFTYNVADGAGGTATGLVTITVNNVNDLPVAAPDSATTREGVAVIIPVLANDTDPDGGALTVTAVGSPGVLLPDNTVQYTPGANFTGTANFSYTISDGQGGTANGQVTVVVGEALERVALLATNSVWLRSGSDVLSGDVIVNQAGAGPFLNGAELSVGGSVTTPAGWDVEGDSLTVAAGAVVGSDVSYNGLTNNGTINGQQRTPLALPVFPALPSFLTATPGTTNVNVPNNGTQTLAPGSYLDLVVGRKGTVTFTGGTYHFRSITVDREAKLFFSAASVVRVQQKLSTKTQTTVGPAAGASIDASSIVFYVAGINGTTGALSATPKAVDIGTNNTLAINLYAPNGTTWLQDGTAATGAFLGKDIDVGLNVQVTLDSAFN